MAHAEHRKKLAPFSQIATDLVQFSKQMQAVEFMQYVIRRSGLESALSQSQEPDDANRLENIEELVSAVQQFEQDNGGAGISDFMQSVALVSDTDEMNSEDYVTIATIHAVKGLEFDDVFLVALEDGIFPTQRAITAGDVEEERRLMYVAITRARKKLFVLNARQRYRFGRTEYLPKSRFVGEMSGFKSSMRYTNSSYSQPTFDTSDRIKLGVNNPQTSAFKRICRTVFRNRLSKRRKNLRMSTILNSKGYRSRTYEVRKRHYNSNERRRRG